MKPTGQNRYARHLSLPDFSKKDQENLESSSVLIVGCGGLGSPVIQYLAASGIGTIGLVDDDVVALSNLQRQVIFKESDIRRKKAVVAKEFIHSFNSSIQTHVYDFRLNSQNILEVMKDYDLVIDGSDNLPTRYLVNDASVITEIPLVHGAIHRYEGQVAVFNYPSSTPDLPINYRDLYPTPPPPHLVPSCSEAGVLGVLPGIIGSMMANEAIKICRGLRPSLANKVLIFDAESMNSRTLLIQKNSENPCNNTEFDEDSLIDYDQFCGHQNTDDSEIDYQQLLNWQAGSAGFSLIDVRETYEFEERNIGGSNIPLSRLNSKVISDLTQPVIFICESGIRSKRAIQLLKSIGVKAEMLSLARGIVSIPK